MSTTATMPTRRPSCQDKSPERVSVGDTSDRTGGAKRAERLATKDGLSGSDTERFDKAMSTAQPAVWPLGAPLRL